MYTSKNAKQNANALSAAWFQDKAILGGMQIDLKFSHLFDVCGKAYEW